MKIVYRKQPTNITINYIEEKKATDNKTEEKGETTKNKSLIKKIIRFIKTLWAILVNKYDTKGELGANSFALILCVIYRMLAIISLLFIIPWCIGSYNYFANSKCDSFANCFANIIVGILVLAVIIILIITFVLLLGIAREIIYEKDRNYIVATFSGVVSFAALIIAVISLFKNNAAPITNILNSITNVFLK